MYIRDGHATLIGFANAPNIKLQEKEVTPPGIDGGGANDTTTMHNSVWRTKQPKKLKTMTDVTFTAAYDPAVYDELVAQVNVNQLITVYFPDGDTLAVWGWINEFKPPSHTEGNQPVATVTVIISNQDDSFNEVAPVFTPAA